MLVEPGSFRTQLLTPESTNFAAPSVADYSQRTAETVTAWKRMNGSQPGDPAKPAAALVELVARDAQPSRFPAGADSLATFQKKARELLASADENRELSAGLAIDTV